MAFVSHAYIVENKKDNMSGYYGKVIYLIIGLTIGIIFIFNINNVVLYIVLITCLISEVVIKLNRFSTNKLIKKTLGILKINAEVIDLNGRIIKVTDIEKISIKIEDFKGKVKYRSDLDFRGMYSDGVKNIMNITTKHDEQIFFNFRISSKKHRIDLLSFMESLVSKNLISKSELIQVLKLSKKEKELLKI